MKQIRKRKQTKPVKAANKIKRRLFTLVCAAALCLITGCGSIDGSGAGEASGTETSGSGAKGRYIETELGQPESACSDHIFVLADGSYVMDSTDERCFYKSVDQGSTWEKWDQTALYDAVPASADVTGLCVQEDGSMAATYIDWENQNTQDAQSTQDTQDANAQDTQDMQQNRIDNGYVSVGADQSVSQGILACEDSSLYLVDLVQAQGKYYGLGMNGCVYTLDFAAQTAAKLFAPTGNNPGTLYSCGRYLVEVADSVPYIYDLTEGKLLETDTVLGDFISENVGSSGTGTLFIAGGEEEELLYIACSKGLYRHVIGGTVMEQLMDGALCNLGNTSNSVADMFLINGSFILLYADGALCSYSYDATVSSVPETEIRIYSLYENPTVRQTISAFRKDHADIYLNYEVGITGEGAVTAEDAIRNLNTQLMAGNGPDILVLDGLPMDSYREKGLLLDLSDVVAQVTAGDRYFTNILKAYDTGEGIYQMPVRFSMPVLAGSSTWISGASSLQGLVTQVQKNPKDNCSILGIYEEKPMLQLLYPTASPELFDAQGGLDEKALTTFLTEAKELYDAQSAGITDQMYQNYNDIPYHVFDGKGTNVVADRLNGGTQVMSVLMGEQAIAAGTISGTQTDTEMVLSMIAGLTDGTIASLPGLTKNGDVFLPEGILGISAASDYQKEAEEFLTLMYSAEIQRVLGTDGYPVNESAFEALYANQEESGASIVTSNSDGSGEANLDIKAVTPEQYETLHQMIMAMTTPASSDVTIQNEILEEGTKVLEGTESVEEGVSAISQKVGIYAEE